MENYFFKQTYKPDIPDLTGNGNDFSFCNETLYRIDKNKCEVILADYEQIRQDFENLFIKDKNIKNCTINEINEWLLSNFAIISETNLNYYEEIMEPFENINKIIEKQVENKTCRPYSHGRGIVYIINENPAIYVDLKGVGIGPRYKSKNDFINKKEYQKPENTTHGNGLFTLSESIYEFIMERMIREILNKSSIMKFYNIETVRSYAVIKLPIRDKLQKDVVSIYVRQAHKRDYSKERMSVKMYNMNRNKDRLPLIPSIIIQSQFAYYGIATHASCFWILPGYKNFINIQCTNIGNLPLEWNDLWNQFLCHTITNDEFKNEIHYGKYKNKSIHIFDFNHYGVISKNNEILEHIANQKNISKKTIQYYNHIWKRCNNIDESFYIKKCTGNDTTFCCVGSVQDNIISMNIITFQEIIENFIKKSCEISIDYLIEYLNAIKNHILLSKEETIWSYDKPFYEEIFEEKDCK